EPRQVAVGRDMRLAASAIAAATIEGAADAGAEVLDLGLVGTEMLYLAVGDQGLDGGIMVTASHNPKEWIGMKIVRRGALPVGGESGLLEGRDRALRGFDRSEGQTLRRVRTVDVWPAFVDRVLGCVGGGERRPVRRGGVDGDAARCSFVDDAGESVPGDFVTALLAESTLAKHPGEKVIYDLRASWAVPETIERAGGIPVVSRVGHAFIKHLMRKEDAVFAGEVSGHYYFREFSQADSGVVPFLLMLELGSRKGQKLSEILRPLRERYFITGELNTPVADVPLKLQELKERYTREGRLSHLDGISVDADGWHMNVRPSNTEPLLRLNLEARSEELMEAKRDEVL